MENKETSAQTEARLLRTIARLVESLTIDAAVSLSQFDPKLGRRGGMLARMAVEEMRSRVLDGRLDLMHASAEEIEHAVNEAVVLAVGKLVGSSSCSCTVTAPGDA
jgi:hypothetical protein